MPGTIYDSRDPFFKQPFGAVPAGETVRFRVRLPKTEQGSPALQLYPIDDRDAALVLPMSPQGSDLQFNLYACSFTPREPELYGYHFEWDGAVLLRGEGGTGTVGAGEPWQLTVYDSAFRCPSILREGVIYQIFPDRFAAGGGEKRNVPSDRTLRSDWGGMPWWRPNEKGEVTNSDYFGGDLAGIEEKLDYLASLGVTVLYLNPIFEAHSNHRYNTADYSRIDPLLGDEEDFRRLCREAKKRGISILLDGVFSHTGSDSVYFNKNRRYGGGGAYNDPKSPYRSWYRFEKYPRKYESWWGFPTLPNVEESDPGYLEYICGENGILGKWLDCGAEGYRLDVADELPDIFLERLYERVKKHGADHAVIGEVWEDASNKVSYGQQRRYLLGKQMDSVMNYLFKDALLSYMRYGNGKALLNTVLQVLENYPKPAVQSLMNFLSTHDTVRAITALGGEPLGDNGREWQEQHQYLNLKQYLDGCQLFKLTCILQFGLPGMPCVYYGDEAGLYGYKDPFNRLCYPWGKEDEVMVEYIRCLGRVRRDFSIFAEAGFLPLTFSDNVCSFIRRHEKTGLLFAVNRSGEEQHLLLPEEFQHAAVLVCTGEFDGQALSPLSGVVLLAQ